jgi:hypothetical protein
MHCRMTSGRPAVSHVDVARMVDVPDIDLPGSHALTRQLGVTAKAQIHVRLRQHLCID